MRYLSAIKITLVAVIGFVLSLTASAGHKNIPPPPDPPRLVNVIAGDPLLSSSEIDALEQKLDRFSASTSHQIAIVITNNIYNYSPEVFASYLGNDWGLGQKGKGNGVVILIKTGEDRTITISPSGGLQGVIPDATAKEIQDREIVPRFKQGEYYEGLNAATDVIMALAKKEYNSDEYSKSGDAQNADKQFGFSIALAIIILIFIIIRIIGRGGRGGYTLGGPGIFFWGSLLGGGGGRGFGGGGGGGFGGFGGGGGFNGGGASSSW